MNADRVTTRHRLLGGVLLRLARLPDAGRFVLRGGMLLRHFFRPTLRPAHDLDLVCLDAFDVEATARRFLPLLADHGVEDGVCFDEGRHRVEGIWLNTAFPGVRIFGCGDVEGVEDEFSVDITYGEPLVPAPVAVDYPVGGHTARLLACRPETIVGRKLHALWHMGRMHWRPKDLHDLMLLGRLALDEAELPGAIAESFASRGDATADARSLFGREWWSMKASSARWLDFVEASEWAEAPEGLRDVVAEVAGRFAAALGRVR